jgi:pimeloyl-ACP methyl ester carboxylesterase/class 3 adenylate cyclase
VSSRIRWAWNGDIAIAYAVVGDGPIDVLYLPPVNSLEIVWDNPLYARFVQRLASFARVIIVDRRGSGLSDRYSPEHLPTLEDLVDDLAVVIEDVGADHPVLFGVSDGGGVCAMFAATRPEQLSGLVLYASAACGMRTDDHPWQWAELEWADWLDSIRSRFGTGEFAAETTALFAPSCAGDEQIVRWMARLWRVASSPSAMYAQERVYQALDIRGLLPAIRVPTLVLHREGDRVEYVGAGRYLASAIADSTYVELPGSDHMPWAGDFAALASEIERFVGGLRMQDAGDFDRVLATVLFTDIVDSTAMTAQLGDRGWRDLVSRHNDIVREHLARFRGEEIDTAGDGFFASFDGPARAIRCASEMRSAVQGLGIDVRSGIHTGECEVIDGKIAGISVVTGARIASRATAGEVLVSSTVKDLVAGSEIRFEDRGVAELKGIPGEWRLYSVAAW